ncbi:MAG: carboxylate--amine ligase [Eubacteriaceae bacterium]|nr:carboxylate--amine ligase [Eubacteriaceae bacterium]
MESGYLLRVFRESSVKRTLNVIERCHEKSGKSRAFIFIDMLNCAVRYGAGFHDYLIFAYWDMNHAQRSTYITRIKNKKLNMICNSEENEHMMSNKDEFYRNFTKYLGREFLDLEQCTKEEFAAFASRHDVYFAKPRDNESGKGIERLKREDFESVDALWDYLQAGDFRTVEEELRQHEDMNRLYPLAINSLRITTLVDDKGVAHLLYAVCKMGNEGKFVDNMENSGLCCPLDPETGEIVGVAHTSALINYDTHPYTGVKLLGYKVPYVKEAIDLCLEAALVLPDVRYVGWDCAITPDGPAIIEGNTYPGYDFWQLPEHTPDKIGLMPVIKELVPEMR